MIKKIIILVVCVCFVFGCGGDSDTPVDYQYLITYSVLSFCSATADITFYSTNEKNLLKNIYISPKWEYEFYAQSGDYLSFEISNLHRLESNPICEKQNVIYDIIIYIFIDNVIFQEMSCYEDIDANTTLGNCNNLFIDGTV